MVLQAICILASEVLQTLTHLLSHLEVILYTSGTQPPACGPDPAHRAMSSSSKGSPLAHKSDAGGGTVAVLLLLPCCQISQSVGSPAGSITWPCPHVSGCSAAGSGSSGLVHSHIQHRGPGQHMAKSGCTGSGQCMAGSGMHDQASV